MNIKLLNVPDEIEILLLVFRYENLIKQKLYCDLN